MAHEYDIMQVCMNGHKITGSMQEEPDSREKFCSRCGKKTISACTECGGEMQGDRWVSNGTIDPSGRPWYTVTRKQVQKFCVNCGEPFPWTRQKIEALNELAAEEESLSDADRESLRQNAPLIATDSPKSELAAVRIKKIMGKFGEESAPAVRKILVGVATEAVKKLIGL